MRGRSNEVTEPTESLVEAMPRKQYGGWRASPSPERFDSEGANEDQAWEFEEMVSEDYDAFGCKKYEIRWANWQRPEDGTDTTWQYQLDDDRVLNAWDKDMARRRKQLAAETLEVEIPNSRTPLHQYITFDYAQAVQEKLDRGKSLAAYANWDLLKPSSVPDNSKEADEPMDVDDASIASAEDSQGGISDSPEPRRSERVRRQPPMSYALRPSKRPRLEHPPSSSSRSSRSSPIVSALEHEWRTVCQNAQAAEISIVNEVTNELKPPLPYGFQYIEDRYHFAQNISEPDPGFLEMCECNQACSNAEQCACQSMADVDAHGRKAFAYDDAGRLKNASVHHQGHGHVIVECNERCYCSKACLNRVAQRPRDVPLQIFRTDSKSRGWGVRASTDIPKGKFLGLYTGLLIYREDADAITGEHKSYIFDLDAMESEDDDEVTDLFSVSAYTQGNWTRFVNHSCDPNLRVRSVVWDTPVSMNRPYLAFFATKDIPAFTELTLDYDPRAAWEPNKGKRTMLEGDKVCQCGASNCRGSISV